MEGIKIYINETKPKGNLDLIYTLKDEITYGGYLVALCSPCLILSTSLILNIHIDLPLLLISYLLPLIIYSYDYYKDIDKDIKNNSERAIFLKKKADKFPYIFSFYILLLISLLILYSNYILGAFILAIIAGGILYNVVFKNFTKKIPAFKNIFTAMNWALVGAFFPLFYNSMDINLSFMIMFVFIFLRVMINVIFFDLKDMENDKSTGIKTLPVMLGKKSTVKVLNLINIVAFIPLIMGVYLNIISFSAIALLTIFFYGYYYINKASSATSVELESTAFSLVDLECIIWPVLLVIANFVI